MNGLKYVGKGAFLVGVPARDLSAEEAKKYGVKRLLASGLYKRQAEDRKRQGPGGQ